MHALLQSMFQEKKKTRLAIVILLLKYSDTSTNEWPC